MKTYGIDVNALTREDYTGTEWYLLALLKEMMCMPLQDGERVFLYTSKPVEHLGELPKGWSWRVVAWPLKKGWTHGGLSIELLRRPPHVFFTPVHEIPLAHRSARIVTTIHDVAFAYIPEAYSFAGRWRQHWAVTRAARQAKRILTISQVSKFDLMRFYSIEEERIAVTPLAVDQAYFETPADIALLDSVRVYPQKYFLHIGRIEKKKNIATLVRAFFLYKKRRGIGDPMRLVLAGSMGEGAREVRELVQRSPFADDVLFAGYVSQEQKRALLQSALAYVFPSRYEGFGIPALEAFASGCPLIASDIPALREVADGTALFAPVDVPSVWADQMERVATDDGLAQRLMQAGVRRVGMYDWKKTAEGTWGVLRQV